MKTSPKGLSFIKQHESIAGYNNKTGFFMPYDDGYGFMTIGYGHKIEPGDNFEKGLSHTGVLDLLIRDIVKFEKSVGRTIKIPLKQNQFDALVALAFNIGVGAFEKSTIVKYINDPQFRDTRYPTPESAWKAWNKCNGKMSRGLVNRRNYEWDLFTNGIY